jgi:hypothetical protein
MTTPGSAVATAAPATSIDPRTARRVVVSGKVRAFARTVAMGIVVFLELDWTPPALASGPRD